MIVEQLFDVQIVRVHRILLELCVREKKERKKEEEEQNLNVHIRFFQL